MVGPQLENPEWIDGFLFVGNHLALNFLNTKPVLEGRPTEFLPDAKAFGRWLVAAGLIDSPRVNSAMRRWRDTAHATRFMQQLRGFRERLRIAVSAVESGSLPAESFVKEVNQLLTKYRRRSVLVREGDSLIRKHPFELDEPGAFWALIAESIASLLVDADLSRMRKCPGCVVHFLDTSKKGARRWCSMNICGNKLKVARYRRRSRTRPPAMG